MFYLSRPFLRNTSGRLLLKYWIKFSIFFPCYRVPDSLSNTYDMSLREKCLYSEIFWYVFSHIRTEYGEIRSISPYSAQMREKTDQKTPNTDTSHAVCVSGYHFLGRYTQRQAAKVAIHVLDIVSKNV